MKLLITGGAGFIGSNFIHYWLEKYPNDKIINLDALTYAGNLENLKDVENPPRVDEHSSRVEAGNPNYEFLKGNVCDAELVNSLVKKVDIIVHFAAESHVDRSVLDSADFIKTNVEGTRVLLDAAKNNGSVRFHLISTDEVFGSLGPNDKPFGENSPYSPRSPYSASKAAADHLTRAYFHTHKLPITISNCSNNYGPYQFPEKLIPLFITNLLEGKKIPIYGTGKNIRDWVHVKDHNAGVDAIIQKGKIGETYFLGGENELENIEVAGKILELMGEDESKIEYVKDRAGHDFRYAIDISKVKKELGWKPEINFDTGLKETVEWFKENQDWWKKIKSGEYKNYYKKQYGK